MKAIWSVIGAVVALLSKLLSMKQTNSWSPEAQIRNLRKEIARLEDEKKLWQNKRSSYIIEHVPVPAQLQSRIESIVGEISRLQRELSALETK